MRISRGALALLAGIAGCAVAVAYAAAPREPVHPAPIPEREAADGLLPMPSITRHPHKLATSSGARFVFTVPSRNPRFGCRLDGRAWSVCQSPVAFARLAAGAHSFSVRSLGRGGRHSRAARFRWRVLEAMDFSIVPDLSRLSALYPGAPPAPLPLTISNPNPVPIFVTSLSASATSSRLDCTSADNLTLIASSASRTTPIKVPAGGSVALPAPGATPPEIQLRDLPFNQDACQRAQFPLTFSGVARG